MNYRLSAGLFSVIGTATPIRRWKNTTNTLDLFYSEFSISPSDHFKDLYKIIRDDEQGVNLNLDHIQHALSEESSGGAFYCGYLYSVICFSWSGGPLTAPAIPSICVCLP